MDLELFADYLFNLDLVNHLMVKTQRKLSRMCAAWGKDDNLMPYDAKKQIKDLNTILVFLKKRHEQFK